jgi:two-component system chemotaxis response regulator CheB
VTDRPPTKVLVIDDSAHNRRTIKQLLESEPDVQVIDWAADGEEGLRKVVDLHPDVVTVDLAAAAQHRAHTGHRHLEPLA